MALAMVSTVLKSERLVQMLVDHGDHYVPSRESLVNFSSGLWVNPIEYGVSNHPNISIFCGGGLVTRS